jgi:ribokinase
MNIDYVYGVTHVAKARENIAAHTHSVYMGGKGLNQSIALARAGAQVWHVGVIGYDGANLKKILNDNGVDTRLIHSLPGASGHAVIQVDANGENSIIIYGGTNQSYTPALIQLALEHSDPDDIVLLQNEINDVPRIMEKTKAMNRKIVFHFSPTTAHFSHYPLEYVDILILNLKQGRLLTQQEIPDAILASLQRRYPTTAIVLTMGSEGVRFVDNYERIFVPAERVPPVDATAGGDTFVGYFLARWLLGDDLKSSLTLACRAAALCITRKGAATSIPYLHELR